MATYHILEPEVSGGLGAASVVDHTTQPPTVSVLDYEFNVWLGDDLLTAHPCFIVTRRLKEAMEAFGGTGYAFDDVILSKDDQFDDLHPGVTLPAFFWMKVHGEPGVDDTGLAIKDQGLVVSDRMLALFHTFNIAHCLIRKRLYRPGR